MIVKLTMVTIDLILPIIIIVIIVLYIYVTILHTGVAEKVVCTF